MGRSDRGWDWIRDQCDVLDAMLTAEHAAPLSPRNLSAEQSCAPVLDPILVPTDPVDNADLIQRGVALFAADIASDTTQPPARLSAGTLLVRVDGTNAVCDVGWEQSVYSIREGPRAGTRVAFSNDLRLGLSPALARTCLRQAGTGPIDEAARRRIMDWYRLMWA